MQRDQFFLLDSRASHVSIGGKFQSWPAGVVNGWAEALEIFACRPKELYDL